MSGPEQERPFSVADGMLFVAAVGLGLAGGMIPYSRPGGRTGWQHDPVIGSVWLALAVTMAALLACLRAPRPGPRRLGRRPGFSACLAVGVTFAVAGWSLGEGLLAAHLEGVTRIDWSRVFWSLGTSVNVNARYAILGSWTIQALARRWRPEPSWLDRLGLAIGGYWIAAPTLIQVVRVVDPSR